MNKACEQSSCYRNILRSLYKFSALGFYTFRPKYSILLHVVINPPGKGETMDNRLHILDYIPLLVFFYGSRLLGISTVESSWALPFYLGGVCALLQMIFYRYRGYSFDFIVLGTNLFLIYGALGYLLPGELLVPYKILKQAAIFLWIGLVGSIATLVVSEGFIQLAHQSRKTVTIASLALLGGVTLAGLVAYLAVTYTNFTALGVIVPFIGVIAIRELLRKYFSTPVPK